MGAAGASGRAEGIAGGGAARATGAAGMAGAEGFVGAAGATGAATFGGVAAAAAGLGALASGGRSIGDLIGPPPRPAGIEGRTGVLATPLGAGAAARRGAGNSNSGSFSGVEEAAPFRRSRSFSAVASSIELEWVFFSATPTAGNNSIIAPALTSSSLANSLIRILVDVRTKLPPCACS